MKTLIVVLFIILFVKHPDIPTKGLLLDLDADRGVVTGGNQKVETWSNNVDGSGMNIFVKRDEGRKIPGSGRPSLKEKVTAINGHNTIVFLKQELLNKHESACDGLITGNGFTWISVLRPYTQVGQLPDVNSFFGSLKNGGNYEGLWAGFTDDNRLWSGGRNGITFGRWDKNNPFIVTPNALDTLKYYVLAGRMGSGQDTVKVELFINDLLNPRVTGSFIVYPSADGSMLAIGQERDAIQHPGVESFNGEITRFLLYNRPLSNKEMKQVGKQLISYYNIPTERLNK